MNNRYITVDELIACYVRDNNCRDVMQARTALESAALEARANGNEQAKQDGLFLLDSLRQWDEQQKAKANTQAPPPKQTQYNAQQANTASQKAQAANGQNTNTQQQAYPADYTLLRAVGELAMYTAGISIFIFAMVWLGGVIVGAAKGAATGAANLAEAVVPYAFGVIAGCVGLLGLKEFFTKKETPTVPSGPAGYTINHYHYGNGVVTNEQTK